MDTRQSFYLASRRDDFAEPVPPSGINSGDIPYIMAANDNLRVKDRLAGAVRSFVASASCAFTVSRDEAAAVP